MTTPKRRGIQLAVHATERYIDNFGEWFFLQRKLNGERMWTDSIEKHPLLVSSYGNYFEFLDHISNAVKDVWDREKLFIPFDGEIYVHGWSRERIDSALRRTVNYNPEALKLEYHIFDIKWNQPQGSRLYTLQDIFEDIPPESPLKLVQSYRATKDDWLPAADQFVQEGYEGAIFRTVYQPYYEGKSVKYMLKYKPTETDEYKIIGVEEAISIEGEPKAMVGSFIVEDSDRVQFKVGAGKLSHELRKHYWHILSTIIGNTLVVKHGKEKTSNGIYVCCVAVEVKNEKS